MITIVIQYTNVNHCSTAIHWPLSFLLQTSTSVQVGHAGTMLRVWKALISTHARVRPGLREPTAG